MAFLAVATIAMVGCKKDEPAPTPTPTPGGGGDDPVEEIPDIAAPGAGKTTIAIYAEVCPKGAYLVGNFTDVEPQHNYDINYDGYTFEAVPDAENWYAATINYTPDRAVKAVARPSTDAVPFSWSYQWGPNFDEAAATPLVPDEAHNNTFILKGDGEFEFENSGEVKLIGMAENAVVYVQVKNWMTSPIVEKDPLATAWYKTAWQGESDWTWREMTAKGNGVFEATGIYNGNGVDINAKGEDMGKHWYATNDPLFEIYEGAKAGDEVKLIFTSEYGVVGKLKLELVSAAPDPDPQPEKDITVKAKVPASWTNTITAWVWPTGGEGEAVTPEKSGDWYVVTKHCSELNIIFRNGTDWAGDVNQTVDLKAAENTCWELASDGATKATATSVDCE
jgi:hypothetical protein